MNFFDRDFDLADALKKADEGDRQAIHSVLGYIASEGDGEADLQELKKEYILKLVDMDSAAGYIMLAECYVDGDLFERDTRKAIDYYQKAAEQGMGFGNECIGELYYYGDGVEKDYQKAFEYFTKEDCKKSAVTNYHLGEMYRLGLYIEKNENEAEEHYLKVVNDNLAEMDAYYGPACYRLAELWYDEEDESGIIHSWKMIEKAKEHIDPDSIVARKVGITKEMIDDLWLQIFKSKEFGE